MVWFPLSSRGSPSAAEQASFYTVAVGLFASLAQHAARQPRAGI
jgi:hypothetical protein